MSPLLAGLVNRWHFVHTLTYSATSSPGGVLGLKRLSTKASSSRRPGRIIVLNRARSRGTNLALPRCGGDIRQYTWEDPHLGLASVVAAMVEPITFAGPVGMHNARGGSLAHYDEDENNSPN